MHLFCVPVEREGERLERQLSSKPTAQLVNFACTFHREFVCYLSSKQLLPLLRLGIPVPVAVFVSLNLNFRIKSKTSLNLIHVILVERLK